MPTGSSRSSGPDKRNKGSSHLSKKSARLTVQHPEYPKWKGKFDRSQSECFNSASLFIPKNDSDPTCPSIDITLRLARFPQEEMYLRGTLSVVSSERAADPNSDKLLVTVTGSDGTLWQGDFEPSETPKKGITLSDTLEEWFPWRIPRNEDPERVVGLHLPGGTSLQVPIKSTEPPIKEQKVEYFADILSSGSHLRSIPMVWSWLPKEVSADPGTNELYTRKWKRIGEEIAGSQLSAPLRRGENFQEKYRAEAWNKTVLDDMQAIGQVHNFKVTAKPSEEILVNGSDFHLHAIQRILDDEVGNPEGTLASDWAYIRLRRRIPIEAAAYERFSQQLSRAREARSETCTPQ